MEEGGKREGAWTRVGMRDKQTRGEEAGKRWERGAGQGTQSYFAGGIKGKRGEDEGG